MTRPSDTMRALVTGGTGFVGNVLAQALRGAGWEVHAIVRPGSAAARTDQLSAAGCVLHRHDGSLQGMREIIAIAQPACTWHLATLFIADHSSEDVIPLVRTNVEFGALLLEALSTRPQAPLVTAGTAWQQHDNAPYSPISLYAATKQAFDALAVYFAEVRRMRIVECLLTDTYGTVDPRKKLLWALANAVRTGTPLPMAGEGRQLMDLLHVDDAVRALLIAGERARGGVPGLQERWAVRPGQPITVRELVERYARARGVSVPVEWGARPARPRETLVPWTAGVVLPGWTPRIALDAGLAGLA